MLEAWLLGSGQRCMICVTLFLHIARVRKHMDMQDMLELHVIGVQSHNACNSCMSVYFLTRSTCKNMQQNLIPLATA